MPFLLRNVSLDLKENEEQLPRTVLGRLKLPESSLVSLQVVRKGIDARKKGSIKVIYTVEVTLKDEEQVAATLLPDPDIEAVLPRSPVTFSRLRAAGPIVIVGAGPAGLFAALRLTEYGLAPTVIERGKAVEERMRDVALFWAKGILDEESNVQFGEGGAGTFSDGKLTTRTRDENLRYVLEKFVAFGAPEEILVLAKPHIGTDLLRDVITAMRRELQSRGATILFSERLTGIETDGGRVRGIVTGSGREIPCEHLILAPGHSARDTYRMLAGTGVALEGKPFAVGLRVEHPQELVNRIQFGLPNHPRLPAAEYAVTYNNRDTGRSAYSFCMCPGGVVVAAASEAGGVVTNGMSGHRRNSPFANSALVVTVGKGDFPSATPLAGIEYQQTLERTAFRAGGEDYRAPAQNLLSFLGDKGSGPVASSYRPGIRETDLAAILPPYVTDTLREGIRFFDRKMRGFITAEATLTGVETRTSAPVRIVRGDNLQSVSLPGLYPAGEGAGYAGGIMSAAVDGIRVAEAIAALHRCG